MERMESPYSSAFVLGLLREAADPASVAGMARYGINPQGTLGVSMPFLRGLARRIGRDHPLALDLWASGVHEARILATLVDDPRLVTEEQMESWVKDLDSWDVCDQLCGNLFDRTPFAYDTAAVWSSRQEPFVKRAGFVLMARLAVHDKATADEPFHAFLALVEREASDDRNYVMKAVNWALRQIVKRNAALHAHAVATAETVVVMDPKAARWVGADALRELRSDALRRRLGV
jgi:3-methyladenine DNA glycosylase AlkD